MIKALNAAIVASVLLFGTAHAFAADAAAPKTKAECKKTADMKWDATSKSCVKK